MKAEKDAEEIIKISSISQNLILTFLSRCSIDYSTYNLKKKKNRVSQKGKSQMNFLANPIQRSKKNPCLISAVFFIYFPTSVKI